MEEQQPPIPPLRVPPRIGPPPPGPELPPMRYDPPRTGTWQVVKKLLAPLGVGLLFLLKFGAKLKFLLPALKFLPVLLKTGGSMILMIGVYAVLYGVWWAVGFVLLIFIHECGHLVAARRLGLNVGAPVFIPFMGAFIALKDAPKNAWVEAQVGIGGPLFGAAGAVACHGIYLVTNQPIFQALAYSGYFLNLFNLAPVGFLDGGRIVTALSPWLWIVGTAVMIALLVLHFNPLLVILLIMSLPRLFSLFRKKTDEEKRYFEVTASQRAFMAFLYFGLAGALALGMKMIFEASQSHLDPAYNTSR